MSEPNFPALTHTATIIGAFARHNKVASEELPNVIRVVFQTMRELGEAPAPEVPPVKPVVKAANSVFSSHIVCMQCGKTFFMLKRHLSTEHGLTPHQYRTKFNLSGTYPMVAPDYAETRSAIAKQMGLGRNKTPQRGVKRK